MPADRLHYLDFELRISGSAGQYSTHVYNSPGGQATNSFTIPLSKDRLELLILRLSRIRVAARRIDTPELEAAREIGGVLFNAVFQGGVRDVLRSSLEKIRQQSDTGLRIKLRLQDAPELADLPWEFLYDVDLRRFLAQSVYTPVVRYIELPESIRPFKVELPLHILGLVAAPSDCAKLDVMREQAMVMEALQPLIAAGLVEITWLEKATLKALRRRLQAGSYQIFHFIGHGGFDKQTEQGVLIFEDEQGRSNSVDAERLGVLLHDHSSLRLAVLNACEGARNNSIDPFAGVATTLTQQGLPAVIAMQFSISDKAAIAFSGEFYSGIAQGFPVDTVVADARKAIFTELSDVEWGTPVLFMRTEDGVLFEISGEANRHLELPDLNSKGPNISSDNNERSPIVNKVVSSPSPLPIDQPKEERPKIEYSNIEAPAQQPANVTGLDVPEVPKSYFEIIPAGPYFFEIYNRIMKSSFMTSKENKKFIPWIMSVLVLFLIILPSFSVIYEWLIDLNTTRISDVIPMIFEAFIFFLVLFLGIGLLFLIRSKYPEIEVLIVTLAFGLVFLSCTFLGSLSNICISDLRCDTSNFIVGFVMALILSIIGYVLSKGINRLYWFFMAPYLAASVWSLLLLLWQIYTHVGIEPSPDVFRAILIMLLPAFIALLFFFGIKNRKKSN
jgi:hypothetical protein